MRAIDVGGLGQNLTVLSSPTTNAINACRWAALAQQRKEQTMNENEIEALGHVKRVLLVVWVIFGFPKDIHGMFMAKEKLISVLNKLSFADVEAWQRNAPPNNAYTRPAFGSGEAGESLESAGG
jgi:hypothetical protein